MRSADSKPKTKAPDGEGCPRCGYHVYAAEQMLARGKASSSISLMTRNSRLYPTNNCNVFYPCPGLAQRLLQVQRLQQTPGFGQYLRRP